MKPADYRRLVASGMTPEQIALVMEMFDARDEERKAGQRARWRKSQQNKRNAHVSSHELTTANVPRAGDARVEDNNLTTEDNLLQENKKSAPKARTVSSTPVDELQPVLDAEHAVAVVEHRKRLGKPLTAYAAKLLAGKFAQFPNPNDAADRMISNGWLRIEADWPDQPTTRAPPRQKPLKAEESLLRDIERDLNGRQEPQATGTGGDVFWLPRLASR